MAIDERNVFWDWSDPAQRADLARYVLENLNEVVKIVKEAEEDLKNIPPWHDPSFDGYDSGEPERVRAQVKAIFQRLQKGKPRAGKYLTYRVEPPDSPKGRQRLRLAREILHWGHSECLGWVLLFAACVLHVRINPLVIITRNKETGGVHALLGYWLYELNFDQVVVDGKNVESNLSHGYIKAVNATRIAVDEEGGTRSFEEAESEAHGGLLPPCNPDWEILFAVDLRKAREEGIKPLLPLGSIGGHELTPAQHFQWRPELDKVKEWWKDESSYGVFAFVGLGGVGKTSLVHRFLAQLPPLGKNADIREEGAEKDDTLPVPDALFIWDFYRYPDVDQCSTTLYNYLNDLTDEKRVSKATFEQVQEVLSRNWRGCRVLLVFDGVEKLQIAPGTEPGKEGGTFGQFLTEGVPLARFLRWCSDGRRPARVLIASRFILTDLRRYGPAGGYHAVTLGELPPESARTLLRACGVEGPDPQLDELIQRFGNHALTLELLGNYIFLNHQGNLAEILSRDIPPLESRDVRIQTDLAETEALSKKLAGVLRFYEQQLEKEDPAALGTLQRLCFFYAIPVDEDLLEKVFSPATEDVAGPLKGLNRQQIRQRLLNLYGKYKLIKGEPLKNPSRFTVHPSIRDYFERQIEKSLKAAIHVRIAAYLSALEPLASLIERIKKIPGENIYLYLWIDEHFLDFLEEVIFHLIHPSREIEHEELCLAWNLYFWGMGGFTRLGAQLGLYSRGARIVQQFYGITIENLKKPTSSDPVALLQKHMSNTLQFLTIRSLVTNEKGIYAFSLGDLQTATKFYRGALELALELRRIKDICVCSANLCEAHILQGHLKNAIDAGAYGLEIARSGNPRVKLNFFSGEESWVANERRFILLQRAELYEQLEVLSAYTGYALALRGHLAPAKQRLLKEAPVYNLLMHMHPTHAAWFSSLNYLAKILRKKPASSSSDPFKVRIQMVREFILFSLAGVYQAAFYLRLGLLKEAYDALEANRVACEQAELKRELSRCDLLLSEAHRIQKKSEQAREALARALAWGVRTGDQEVLVWGNLISARLALDFGDLSGAEKTIREALRIASFSGYGLYWIDLQVVKGQWELACGRQLQEGKVLPPELEIWTPQQWFERAEISAFRALNGQLENSDDPAPQPDWPEDQLAMLGARHPECGYAWGEGDALHVLAEARFELAQCIGPEGHDSKGRSYNQLLEEAHQAGSEALALRERIQDPKAKETRDLLAKIREIRGGDGS